MTTNILDSINSLPLILQILFWWHVIAFVFAFVDRLLELSTGSSFLEVKLNGRSVIESFVLLCFSLLLIIISIVFSFFLTASLPIWIIFYLVWSIFSYFVSSVAYCLRLTFHPKTLFMLLGLLVNGAIVFTAIHYTKAFGMENWFFIFLLAFSITLVECLLSYYLFEELKEYKNTKFATRKFSFREARAYVSRNVIFKTALIILITVFAIDFAINLHRFMLYQMLFIAMFQESSFHKASFFETFRYALALVMPFVTIALPIGCSVLADFSKRPFPCWKQYLKPNLGIKNLLIAFWIINRVRIKQFFPELKLSFVAVLFWPYFLFLALSKFMTGGKK